MISTVTWVLPRPPRSRYKGGFPLYFEQNLVQLLGYPDRILHPFGGRAEIGTRVDISPLVEPDVVADAHDLPFDDDSFDLVVLDPPYSDVQARELYDTKIPLRPGVFTAEAVRVCRPGGWLAVYTDREPRRPARCNHAFRIVVVLRPGHSPRVCMVFQKRKPGMPNYGTEAGELLAVSEREPQEAQRLAIADEPTSNQPATTADHAPAGSSRSETAKAAA